MDKLLLLLKKYNCHLKRDEKNSIEFLQENFNEYIFDVKAALDPDDNQVVGMEMCRMVT